MSWSPKVDSSVSIPAPVWLAGWTWTLGAERDHAEEPVLGARDLPPRVPQERRRDREGIDVHVEVATCQHGDECNLREARHDAP
jgi:hypothetical protein